MKPNADCLVSVNDFLGYPPAPRQVPCACDNCGSYLFLVDFETKDLICPMCGGLLSLSDEGF